MTASALSLIGKFAMGFVNKSVTFGNIVSEA